jgi:fused signal recognition particle receptor
MNWLYRWIEFIADFLAKMGVPEAYQTIGAMGLLYFLATFIVLLVIFSLLRLARRKRKGVSEERFPSPEEPVEKGPAFEEERKEEEAPLIERGEEEAVAAEKPPAAEIPSPELPSPPTEEPPSEGAARELQPEIEKAEAELPVSLFDRMRAGLAKTHSSVMGRIDAVLSSRKAVDEDLLEELEEIFITADFGMNTTQDLMRSLEKHLAKGHASSPEALREALREEIRLRVRLEAAPLDFAGGPPFVIMVVGVNGVGKTTTIGKLANQFVTQGKKVVLGAGDTFRAAAAEQLSIWADRAGVDVIRHAEGADPAAVAFDAAKAAVARGADVLILDTAGRLHTKANLMEELKKIRRVLAREIPEAPHETLLVLDATTGQNGLVQARLFKEAVAVSGIVLTKLDGTAKGGIVVAIGTEIGLPVRFVGIGEGIDDLRPFDPDLFVEALFQKD